MQVNFFHRQNRVDPNRSMGQDERIQLFQPSMNRGSTDEFLAHGRNNHRLGSSHHLLDSERAFPAGMYSNVHVANQQRATTNVMLTNGPHGMATSANVTPLPLCFAQLNQQHAVVGNVPSETMTTRSAFPMNYLQGQNGHFVAPVAALEQSPFGPSLGQQFPPDQQLISPHVARFLQERYLALQREQIQMQQLTSPSFLGDSGAPRPLLAARNSPTATGHHGNQLAVATQRQWPFGTQTVRDQGRCRADPLIGCELATEGRPSTTRFMVDDSIVLQPTIVTLPAPLYCPADDRYLTPLQVLLRQHLEAFEATESDVSYHIRGRNKPVTLGQVELRCRHCAHIPAPYRAAGSTYYPKAAFRFYQAAQNMNKSHMQSGICHTMPISIKKQFHEAMIRKVSGRTSIAGRQYWAESTKTMNLVDTENGVFCMSSEHRG